MTTLSSDQTREYYHGDKLDVPVVAADIIYRGAAVGDNGSGYARPLQAGDPFLGFAELKANNILGTAGAIKVRVFAYGRILLPISGLTIADVGRDVYASDDNTFTLTQGANTRIGFVDFVPSSNYGIVAFERVRSREDELVDSSGGTSDGVISDVGASFSQSAINNNFAELAAKINYLLRARGA